MHCLSRGGRRRGERGIARMLCRTALSINTISINQTSAHIFQRVPEINVIYERN